MTVTLNTMLPALAKTMGAWLGSFETTTDIAASTSLVSTELRDAGYTDDDALEDVFVRIKGTTNDGVIRRVESFTASTGTLTLSGENLTAETAARTFELYDRNPQELIDALNEARLQAFPALHRRVINRDLTGGFNQHRWDIPDEVAYITKVFVEKRIQAKTYANNLLADQNCDLEDALITTDWATDSVGVDPIKESESNNPDNFLVFAGQQSGALTVTLSTVKCYLTVEDGGDYDGKRLSFAIWVYAIDLATGDSVKAAVSLDAGSNWTLGDAHSGKGWQRLTVTATGHRNGTSDIYVGFEVKAAVSVSVYFDEAILVAGPSAEPAVKGDPVLDWVAEGRELVVPGLIAPYESLVLEAVGPVSSVSSGTDTMEIDERQARTLYYAAASILKEQEFDAAQGDELNSAQRIDTHWRNKLDGSSMALPAVRRSPVA